MKKSRHTNERHFDFRAGIIRQFNLRFLPSLKVGFTKIAAYGHVGRTDIILPLRKWIRLTFFDTFFGSSNSVCTLLVLCAIFRDLAVWKTNLPYEGFQNVPTRWNRL